MPVPTWVDGNPLPASDINAWFVPKVIIRTTTQTITSNATLANDNQLVLAVDANAVYHVRLVYRYNAATAGDFQFDFTVPAGATHTNIYLHCLTGAAVGSTDDALIASQTNPGVGGISTATDVALLWESILTTAGTAGNLQPRVAQLSSFATSTSVLPGSLLIAQRIG
jgi:hypothetical protein